MTPHIRHAKTTKHNTPPLKHPLTPMTLDAMHHSNPDGSTNHSFDRLQTTMAPARLLILIIRRRGHVPHIPDTCAFNTMKMTTGPSHEEPVKHATPALRTVHEVLLITRASRQFARRLTGPLLVGTSDFSLHIKTNVKNTVPTLPTWSYLMYSST